MNFSSPLRGLRALRQHRGVPGAIAASLLVNAVVWLYIIVRIHPQGGSIPLHYTTTFGIDRIGPWYAAFMLPLSGSMILVVNFLLTLLTVEAQRTTAQVITVLTLCMELSLLASAILIFRTVT